MVVDPMNKNGIVRVVMSTLGKIFYDPAIDNTPKKLSKKVREKRKNEKKRWIWILLSW